MKSREIYISFSDIDDMKTAIEIAESYPINIVDIISPTYLGLKDRKYKGSLIGITSFIFSIFALIFVVYFQWWTSSKDYPMNIGGSEFFSWTFSIPVAYELTILFAAIGVFFAFLFMAKLPKWLSSDSNLYDMKDELILIIKDNGNTSEYLSKIKYNEKRHIQ
jgi:hypothetical protein